MPLFKLLILPIKVLKDAGIFGGRSAHGLQHSLAATKGIHIALPGMSVQARLTVDRSAMLMDLELPGDTIETMVSLQPDYLPMGTRWYFKCPCCGMPRTFLIVDGKRLVCRSRYVDQPSRLSKAHRRAAIISAKLLLEEIKPRVSRPGFMSREGRIAMPAEAPRKRKTRALSPNWQVSLSTPFAINNGKGADQFDQYFNYLATPSWEWRTLDCGDFYERPVETGINEAFPALDIKVLSQRLMTHREGVTATTLFWGDRATRFDEVLLFIDWRNKAEGQGPLIMVCFDFNRDRPRWQRLEIHVQENGRFRWICPIEKTNFEVLFLRDGTFASRKAHRLYNDMQRAPGRRARAAAVAKTGCAT